MGGQTGEYCLPYLTDGLKNCVRYWSVIWRVPSSFFENISSAIFLSENAFLRNIRKQAKKQGRKSLEAKIWLRRYRQSFARRAAKLPKPGLRWSQNSNYSNRKQWSTYKGRKIEWLALFFFRRKQSRMLGKRKVKVTENCVENTDFAYHTRQHIGRATCPVNSRPAYQAYGPFGIGLASDDVRKLSNAWQRGKLVLNKGSAPYKSMLREKSLTWRSSLFLRREVRTVLTTPSLLSASHFKR